MTVFEKIIVGEIPCNKVIENDKFLAFHDINPKAPIHILIIPKKHFENIQEMEPDLMGEMLLFIQQVARLMGVDKSGYRLVTNCGENGGQEVMHLHFHMLGGAKLGWTDAAIDPQSTF
ncbi:histidine triad nucleotide-binding protein [Campylobacter sp. faydin G-24]|uniref:Histidine triad nucleotide-binding protein n=1 Tax=Campylobacter anatolicus TaxID=2829105 RepID=A0ABS5HG48_9BACT|nr:histidine triad nucleotide-binding protein [Campylobacter anatolicus]MBR8462501.1 histidine triad nucleotide-binding protein [Campylobacter anatolicus]MBR8463067.1 histidine triad nucleotide-binding protein [Campylobacter anatolicus]MBR8465612.1 histidine triad nucleotide-binding protein [Campylobacter anatolicus]